MKKEFKFILMKVDKRLALAYLVYVLVLSFDFFFFQRLFLIW